MKSEKGINWLNVYKRLWSKGSVNPKFPHLTIVEEHDKDSEEPPSKVIASVFKSDEECSLEEKKLITDSKQVLRKLYDARNTTSDLARAQRSDLIVYGLRQKAEGLPLNKEVYDADALLVISQFWNKFHERLFISD